MNIFRNYLPIDQFRCIKIQPKIIDLSTRLMAITTEFVGFIPKSLVLKSIVLGSILIYRNWSIHFAQFEYAAITQLQNQNIYIEWFIVLVDALEYEHKF